MTKGLNLYFRSKPKQSLTPPPYIVISENNPCGIGRLFPTWLDTNVLREMTTPISLLISIILMRPKKMAYSSNHRIFLAKTIASHSKFKMDTVTVFAETISVNLWTCSIDFIDAYFHIRKIGNFTSSGRQGQEQRGCNSITSVRSISSSVCFRKSHRPNKI